MEDTDTLETGKKHSLTLNWAIKESSDCLAKSGATIGSPAGAGYSKVSMES